MLKMVCGALESSESWKIAEASGDAYQLPPENVAFAQVVAEVLVPCVHQKHTRTMRSPSYTFAAAFAYPLYWV
jgi:hypothetical protein